MTVDETVSRVEDLLSCSPYAELISSGLCADLSVTEIGDLMQALVAKGFEVWGSLDNRVFRVKRA